jgi:glutathione S-transferase
MNYDMYPSDIEESYLVEKIGEILTVDCLFPDPTFFAAKDKIAWGVERSKTQVPKGLDMINRNCQDSMKKNGWACTNKLSLGDIYVIHWLSTVIFNPFFGKENSKHLEKYPVIQEYWKKTKPLI